MLYNFFVLDLAGDDDWSLLLCHHHSGLIGRLGKPLSIVRKCGRKKSLSFACVVPLGYADSLL